MNVAELTERGKARRGGRLLIRSFGIIKDASQSKGSLGHAWAHLRDRADFFLDADLHRSRCCRVILTQ